MKPELAGIVEIKKGESLFDEDDEPFRDKIPIPDQQHAFVAAGIKASLDIGLTGKSGDLRFGFSAGSETVLKNYRLFALNDQIVPAIKTLFQNFVVPGDLQDIESMPAGSLATVEGTGSLKFSATANLLSAVNPLASREYSHCRGHAERKGRWFVECGRCVHVDRRIPSPDTAAWRAASFNWGTRRSAGRISVSARRRRLEHRRTLGAFDLIQGVLKAVSADPVPDKDVFS